MEDATEVRGHQCPKCTLVENEDTIAAGNLSKLQKLPMMQAHARIKRVLGVIVQIVLVAISVALLSEGSIRQGAGMLLLACLVHFALPFLTKAEDTITELGVYTLPRFAGHMMWYGFICTNCGEQNCDFIHGHNTYLICRSCKTNLHVNSSRFYTNDGRPAPSEWREFTAIVRFWWKTRKTRPNISRT